MKNKLKINTNELLSTPRSILVMVSQGSDQITLSITKPPQLNSSMRHSQSAFSRQVKHGESPSRLSLVCSLSLPVWIWYPEMLAVWIWFARSQLLTHRFEFAPAVSMESVVKFMNQELSLFAVETDNRFRLFGFEDTNPTETADVGSGFLESAACDSPFNYPRDAELEVYVRDMVPTLEGAEALVYSD